MSSELGERIAELGRSAVAAVLFPLIQVAYRESVIWWPFLLSGLLVAVLVFSSAHGWRLASLAEFRRRYLGKAIWAHPSARADYVYYLANSALYALIVAPLVVAGASVANAVEGMLRQLCGPLTTPLLGPGTGRLAYTLLFFLAYDFGRFLAHNLLHEVPLLWQFHRLHHSAQVLTPLTTFRAHPVELFLMSSVPNLATGSLSGVAWYLSGGEIGFYTFLGLHVLMVAFNAIANLRHWQVWISFGPVLNRWLISPAHHQIHHSLAPHHMGRNRGFELAIWDRMLGTLCVPEVEETYEFGLGDGSDGEWHSLGRMYGWPVRGAFSLLRRRLSRLEADAGPRAAGAAAQFSRMARAKVRSTGERR